jgi:hypothetical protein
MDILFLKDRGGLIVWATAQSGRVSGAENPKNCKLLSKAAKRTSSLRTFFAPHFFLRKMCRPTGTSGLDLDYRIAKEYSIYKLDFFVNLLSLILINYSKFNVEFCNFFMTRFFKYSFVKRNFLKWKQDLNREKCYTWNII